MTDAELIAALASMAAQGRLGVLCAYTRTPEGPVRQSVATGSLSGLTPADVAALKAHCLEGRN